MGQWGGGRFYQPFDKRMYGHLNVKHINVYSLSVIFFFRSCIKTLTERAIEAGNKTTNVSTA